jgi:hypothetical protein
MSRSNAPKATSAEGTAPPLTIEQPASPKSVAVQQFQVVQPQLPVINGGSMPVVPQQLQLHSQEPLLTINEESLRQLLAIFPPN